jgi:hypothetical protein
MHPHTVKSIGAMSFRDAYRALAEQPKLRQEFFDSNRLDKTMEMARTELERVEGVTCQCHHLLKAPPRAV